MTNKKRLTVYLPHNIYGILQEIYADKIRHKQKQSMSKLIGQAVYRMYRDRAVYLNKIHEVE